MSKSTSTMSKPAQMYGVQDWRTASATFTTPEVHRDATLKDFYGNFWPATQNYVSPLNPTFLLDLPETIKTAPKDSYLIRDGLIPLIWFFTKNPTPEGFKSNLCIHADFEEYVPDAWRPQCSLYRHLAGATDGYETRIKKASADNQVKQIYLLGLLAPSICSIMDVEQNLKDLVEFIGGPKKASQVRVRAFLPTRFEPNDIFTEPSFPSRFITLICKYLNTDIEFLEFEGLRSMYPEDGSWIHEFNGANLYADSFISSVAISKGMRPIPVGRFAPPAERKAFEKIVPLFPHVSCGITSQFRKPFINYLNESWIAESEERAKVFNRTVSVAANRVFPWPQWFNSWCREIPQKA